MHRWCGFIFYYGNYIHQGWAISFDYLLIESVKKSIRLFKKSIIKSKNDRLPSIIIDYYRKVPINRGKNRLFSINREKIEQFRLFLSEFRKISIISKWISKDFDYFQVNFEKFRLFPSEFRKISIITNWK